MKYHQPYDQPASPNAAWVNGNPSIGLPGSIIDAQAIEFVEREVVSAITDVGLATPTDSDLAQLSKAIRFMRMQYVVDAGAPNLLSVVLSPAPATWATPLAFVVKIGAGNTNTSSTVTLAISGLSGAKNIVKRDGTALANGDLTAGMAVLMVYDGTALRCMTVLASDLASSISNTFNFSISYGVDTSGTPGTIVAASMSPAITSLSTGLFAVVKVANANPGAVTAQLGSTAAKPVVSNDGLAAALAPNTFPAGGCNAFMVYDGTITSWVLLNVSSAAVISPPTAPFYPEVLTGSGVMTVTGSTGSVAIGANQTWQHRGLREFSTAGSYFSGGSLSLATAGTKTYHLRWDAPGTGRATPAATYPYGRFYLADLADTAVYNPSSLGEANVAFDTSYDSMLIARVVTDGANNPTVRTLLNKIRFAATFSRSSSVGAGVGDVVTQFNDSYTMNFARAPVITQRDESQGITANYSDGWETSWGVSSLSRYGFTATHYTICGFDTGGSGITPQSFALIYTCNALMLG